jgi:hypothetical protein
MPHVLRICQRFDPPPVLGRSAKANYRQMYATLMAPKIAVTPFITGEIGPLVAFVNVD